MSEWLQLSQTWKEARDAGHRALLFTLVDVVGSSYRKPGAHMLVTADGAIAGSVSAGCIEADLLARMDELFSGPLPQVLSYTNTGEDEFALNRGCNGDICIYVQEVDDLTSLAAYELANKTRTPQVHTIEVIGKRLFVQRIQPAIRLFIFGNQRDAEPIMQLAKSIDMEVTLFKKSQAAELASIVPDARTAVILMSHDFERDCEALAAVSHKPFPYVGIMGPRYRTEEMLRMSRNPVEATLKYPVGISIGADGADEIAVSIIAELIDTFRRAPKIATVILAAGQAKRYGTPKQLALYKGLSFIRRIALESLHVPESSETAVVLGAYADEVERELAGLPVKTIPNENWALGMGTSIAAAARWAKDNNYDGILLATCDQVLVERFHLSSLLVGPSAAPALSAAEYAGTFGIPCYFHKSFFDELISTAPTSGAKGIIKKHATAARLISMPVAAVDIDTPEQLPMQAAMGIPAH
jgi:molybdenum cofactor cytidylyltransferase